MTNISNEGNDEELLARLDPEVRELAQQIGDKIANLTYLVEERTEQERRVDQLEVQVRDLVKVAKVFADAGTAERIIENAVDNATGYRQAAYMRGWADGLAGRTLAADGVDSEPDESEAGTPAVRAFLLGREIERRRWERLAETMPTEPLCGTCDTSIEHIPAHLDGRPGGWRHTTDHGQEPHTAYPGGGGRS